MGDNLNDFFFEYWKLLRFINLSDFELVKNYN